MDLPERDLVEQCLARREEAWQEFVRIYDPVLRKFATEALRSVGRPATAADVDEIRSDALAALVAGDFRALRSFRWQCRLESWLRVIVRTVFNRAVRGKSFKFPGGQGPGLEEPPLERLLKEETRQAARRALQELPARDRLVLSMFFVDGRPYREIAKLLKLPMGTVATLLSRARSRLRDKLTES
ncbi:MAG: RNA polymerase sigma factor [Vicinamibacteria bacterium]